MYVHSYLIFMNYVIEHLIVFLASSVCYVPTEQSCCAILEYNSYGYIISCVNVFMMGLDLSVNYKLTSDWQGKASSHLRANACI